MRSQCTSADFFVGESNGAVVEGWDVAGQQVAPENPNCVAKRVTDPTTKNRRHYTLRAISGPEPGTLFNRLSMYSTPLNGRGNTQYAWRPASEECFTYYVEFLVTGNEVFLRRAERSLDN